MNISFVLINCELNTEESVMEELRKIDSVKEVIRVMGSYDIVIKLEEESARNLKDTISSKIRPMKKIKS